MGYVKIYENLEEEEFNSLLENMQCDLEGTTHFTEPEELVFTGGINVMWCYEEESDKKIDILFSTKYENDKKLYDIWEIK